MDLIGEISSKLGVDSNAAQALAGTLLDTAKNQVGEQLGQDQADKMAAAIPELDGWRGQATALLGGDAGGGDAGGGAGGLLGGALGALTGGGGGGAGGLMGALGGALGGGSGGDAGGLAALLPLLGKLDLSPESLQTVAPLALSFLEDRLPDGLADKIKGVLPLLGGGGGLGSLLGALGK